MSSLAVNVLTHPVVRHSPLHIRDALYGGRTEALRLHYKIAENEETIRYCDVMSLSPYICKYFKFPIGHPVVHAGDTCKDIRACLQTDKIHDSSSDGPVSSRVAFQV